MKHLYVFLSGLEGGELHIAEVPHHGQLPSVSDWEHTDLLLHRVVLLLHRREQAASAASGESSGGFSSDCRSPHSQTSTAADWWRTPAAFQWITLTKLSLCEGYNCVVLAGVHSRVLFQVSISSENFSTCFANEQPLTCVNLHVL